jgi:hypothetical protein
VVCDQIEKAAEAARLADEEALAAENVARSKTDKKDGGKKGKKDKGAAKGKSGKKK